MNTDFTGAQSDLRRSRARDAGHAVAGSEQPWEHRPVPAGTAPLAGALARGRGNGPSRAQGLQSAQSIYGNRSVQRFLSARPPGYGPTPVQRFRFDSIPVSDEQANVDVASIYQASGADSGVAHDARSRGEDAGGGTTVVSAPAAAPSSPQLVAPSSPQLFDRSREPEEPTILYSQPSVTPPISQSEPGSSPAPETDLDLPRPHTAPSGLELMSLTKRFEQETEQNPNYKDKTATGVSIKTKYLADEQERRPYEVSVGKEGKLYQGGQLLETGSETASAGFRAAGSAGGHLYAMSPAGQIYSADQSAEWQKGGMQGPSARVRKEHGTFVPSDPGARSAEATPFHHSSFLAGGDVAGAGEMKAHEGILSMISNASGHYRPGSAQVMQTLNRLQASGAPVEQARVHLMGDFGSAGYDASKEVTAAVGEYMAAEGSRGELLKRHRVTDEIRKAFGVGMQDAGLLKGQEMPPPESDEIKEAQKEALTNLGARSPFNKSFRSAKQTEAVGPQAEGQKPLLYSEFMKRATGRDIRPKAKETFSFSMPAPSIAPVSEFSEPVSSPAYQSQSESAPYSSAPAEDSSGGLPSGYIQKPEDGTY